MDITAWAISNALWAAPGAPPIDTQYNQLSRAMHYKPIQCSKGRNSPGPSADQEHRSRDSDAIEWAWAWASVKFEQIP